MHSEDQIQDQTGVKNQVYALESDFYLFLLGLKPSLGYKQRGDNGKVRQITRYLNYKIFF